jgi:phytoene dehydrogenase-like protein
MAEDFDVVIVGAGHNGLVAGSYLAKAGRRVAIVDRGAKVGGMTSSGFMIPEAPQHLVTPCAVEVIFLRGTGIIEELELVKHGYKTVDPDPSYVYLHPDGNSIALFRDPKRTAEDMAYLSKADGKAYLEFMKVIDAMMDIGFPFMTSEPGRPKLGDALKMGIGAIRNARLKNELVSMTTGTADQVACEWFEHPAAIALLTGIAAGAGPIDDDGNAAAYMLFGLLHRLGVGKPIGSLQTVSNALAGAFVSYGGTLHLNSHVEEILISDGKARGVRIADGRVINAPVVIATCDPHTAFKLTTPGGIERRLVKRLEHAPSNRSNAAPLLANIAMSKPLRLKKHQDMRRDGANINSACGLIGVPDEVRQSFAYARRGEIPTRHAVSVSPITNWDPSQAPANNSVAYVYLPAMAVDTREGWSQSLKDKTMASIIAQISEFYDGFDAEVGRFVETARDREKRLNVTNGCVTHIDFGAQRTGNNRPATGLANPGVDGFYLGGAGTHPGGGVSGLPGRIASEKVQRYLKKIGRR